MPNIEKFPFEYSVQATRENPDSQIHVETPWIDEDRDLISQIEIDYIYKDDDLIISEFKYENGFHFISIVKNGKSIIKSNWELDYVSPGNYLPKIQ